MWLLRRIWKITNRFHQTTVFDYDAAGRLAKRLYCSRSCDEFSYDSRNRMVGLMRRRPDGTSFFSNESYTYWEDDNLKTKTAFGRVWSYEYDGAEQLLSEVASDYAVSYAYDGNGNRTSKTENGAAQGYEYDAADKLDRITGAGWRNFFYDDAGRPTHIESVAGHTWPAYDYDDRVSSITHPGGAVTSFAYNGLGARAAKATTGGGSFSFKRDGADVLAPMLSDGAAFYTPGVSELRGSQARFFHPDRLGSFPQATGAYPGSIAKRKYDAFGVKVRDVQGSTPAPWGFAGTRHPAATGVTG